MNKVIIFIKSFLNKILGKPNKVDIKSIPSPNIEKLFNYKMEITHQKPIKTYHRIDGIYEELEAVISNEKNSSD